MYKWKERCYGDSEINKKLNTIDPSMCWKLFDAQVEPTLTYAAEVRGFEDVSHIEKVHTFAIKRYLNVPLHSSNKMIH